MIDGTSDRVRRKEGNGATDGHFTGEIFMSYQCELKEAIVEEFVHKYCEPPQEGRFGVCETEREHLREQLMKMTITAIYTLRHSITNYYRVA